MVVLVSLLLLSTPPQGDDIASRAWALYAAANYQEALNLLDQPTSESPGPTEQRTRREYRALCLIALDRSQDAARVIDQIIGSDVFYRPDSRLVPLRYTSLFNAIRRERVQMRAHDEYLQAVQAYDERRFADSTTHLALVQRLIDSVDSATEAPDDPDGGWLQTLSARARQFLDTIRVQTESAPEAPASHTFDRTNADVLPPVPLSMTIPEWQDVGAPGREGELVLTIDEAGNVEEAALTKTMSPELDGTIRDAARSWTFRPAVRGGHPVRYRLAIVIRQAPRVRGAVR